MTANLDAKLTYLEQNTHLGLTAEDQALFRRCLTWAHAPFSLSKALYNIAEFVKSFVSRADYQKTAYILNRTLRAPIAIKLYPMKNLGGLMRAGPPTLGTLQRLTRLFTHTLLDKDATINDAVAQVHRFSPEFVTTMHSFDYPLRDQELPASWDHVTDPLAKIYWEKFDTMSPTTPDKETLKREAKQLVVDHVLNEIFPNPQT